MNKSKRRGKGFLLGRWLLAVVFSVGLVVTLVLAVDTSSLRLRASDLQWHWALGSLAFVLLAVALRGLRLQQLAQREGHRIAWARWTHVAALHQLLFTVLPSGFGDAGFPVLVAKSCRLSVVNGALILTLYRLHDFCMLGAALLWGITLLPMTHACQLLCIASGAALAIAPLAVTAVQVRHLLQVACRIATPLRNRRIVGIPVRRLCSFAGGMITLLSRQEACVTRRWDLTQTVLTMSTWACALGNYACLFRMAGLTLPFLQLLLVVGGLNLCGALAAFAIGGIGVGESALVGILIALGFSASDALPISLIVRPAALISVLTGSLLIAGLGMSPNRQAKEAHAREDHCTVHVVK